MKTSRLLVVFVSMASMMWCSILCAQHHTRDLEKESQLWQELQKVAPAALEDFRTATVALDSGNYAEAVRLYARVTDAAPDFDPALRRRGGALVELGQIREGLSLLDSALAKKRSVENLATLSQYLAYPGKEEGLIGDKRRALQLIKEANTMFTGTDVSYPLLFAQIALDVGQENDLRTATEALRVKHPNEMVTHYFSGILAILEEDWIRAEEEIRTAETMGLSHEVAENILEEGIGMRATVWHWFYYTLYAVAGWIGGLLLLFIIGKMLSAATLRSVESADPNGAPSQQELSMRKYYKKLIAIAGAYYYISLPFIIVLVVGITASIIYAFFVAGRIPMQLVLALGIGASVTVFQMIRTLFIKMEDSEPERVLAQEEAPKLWALVCEVAERVGTRPVDVIELTTGTELAVYEKGTSRERAEDRATRVLILGAGVLHSFRTNAFRAVLAHEYGHFSHRDTAGGEVAMRVQADMMKFAYALAGSGLAVWWNLGFQFFRVYHFLFRRISHGATRLQEVLADRVAVYCYGAQAFEEGLSHVIAQSVEFDHLTGKEIESALQERRDLQNLYELRLPVDATEMRTSVEDSIREILNSTTTDDDTHPCPVDRFRLAQRIQSRSEADVSGVVWDLFANRAALIEEMNVLVSLRLQKFANT